MIKSVGIDVVDIQRFKKLVDRWGIRFCKKILTEQEIELCANKANYIASVTARFAAKEAMIKCLPTDQHLVWRWHEMEVLNEVGGKPIVKMNGVIGDFVKGLKIHVSLSHSQNSAMAIIILEKLD
jgi:holo-[acyl-carrier protein] synthase